MMSTRQAPYRARPVYGRDGCLSGWAVIGHSRIRIRDDAPDHRPLIMKRGPLPHPVRIETTTDIVLYITEEEDSRIRRAIREEPEV